MYLLDTNVITELRKADKAEPAVVKWVSGVSPTQQFMSVITLMELEMGVLAKERIDHKQGSALRTWLLTSVLPAFNGRILEFNADAAFRCASLHVPDRRSFRDAMIAAIALENGVTVVTRNVKDFKNTPVKVINPWEPQRA